MSKSALYAANTTTQTVATGNVVNFGQIVRRFGAHISLSGGNAQVMGTGYYGIATNLSFTATAGTAVIQLYIDGVAIPGASATVTTAAATNYQVAIPAIIKESCCKESTITAVITGVTATVGNAAIEVVKL